MLTKGTVKGIISNLVIVEVEGPVTQNEIAYIDHEGTRLMAEVIKIVGKNASVQVFESTRGLKVGSKVEFQGHMLEVVLGPGLLQRNLDGLENDLDKMDGVFLKRGEYTFLLMRKNCGTLNLLLRRVTRLEPAHGWVKLTKTISHIKLWYLLV